MTDPTSDWNEAYRQPNPAPWDIGRPQPVFAALVQEGRLGGTRVLDAGCGTGEHALLMAQHGANVTGIDLSETAVRIAQQKAADRGLVVTFEVGDVLTMPLPSHAFDTVIDSGLFHVFDDNDRRTYVSVLSGVIGAGGVCCLMCFSDKQPGDWGPRRVTRDEIEDAFSDGWTIETLEPAEFDINPTFDITRVQAWLAMIRH